MDTSSYKKEIIKVENLSKEFPGVKALSNFTFDLFKKEVHCLIGENGAGKSTFIKILSGALIPNGGNIYIEGESYSFLTPHIARKIGIQTVYQEDILIPQITAAENIFLGSENSGQKFFINYSKTMNQAKRLASQLGVDIRMEELYEKLSPADQQFVKILKALAQKPKVLILDEPTQAFNIEDVKIVTDMVKGISRDGVSIIYISHNLEEIIEVADRVTVLRDGEKVNTHDKRDGYLNPDLLAKEMVGRSVELFYKKKKHKIGDYIFEVKGLKLKPSSKPINFKVREGEILGIAGLKGSGRTEIAKAIFGAMEKYEGKIFYKGKDITPNSPVEAVKEGISMLTENKKVDGLFMAMAVDQNITLVGLERVGKVFINIPKEKILARNYINRLNIKTPSLSQEVRFLSGGNQQKVVLAKWLFKGVHVLIVDEPTHGIDVNAKVEVYGLLTELASEGKSIIMISSEMPELIAMSDRIIVIKNFEISKVLFDDKITEENILLGFMEGSSKSAKQ